MTTISRARRPLMLLAALAAWTLSAPDARAVEVRVCTNHGPMTIELFDAQAPLAVANFLGYVEQGFYTGTAFHRVINGSLIQAGGFDRQLRRRTPGEPVPNESDNGLRNARGTVAAARQRDADSATSQFFINLRDNESLDGSGRSPGFTVFGRVIAGLDVADEIGSLPTGSGGTLSRDVPSPLAVIDAITILDPAAAEEDEATLRARLTAARKADDGAAALDAIEGLRARCAELAPELLVAEAEASFALGRTTRASYVLDDFFARAEPTTPGLADAQTLFRRLPPLDRAGVGPLIAHCTVPDVPAIPDGSVASLDTMVHAQEAVRHFMELSDAFLDCLSEVIDEEALTDNQEVAAVGRHNETVERMEALARDFNRQVRAFKAREE